MPNPTVPRRLKQAVAERAAYLCEYCCSREDHAVDPFAAEHIVPRSRGGQATFDNLAFSCQTCNSHKYTKIEAVDPLSGEIVPIFHPRQQSLDEHFAWNEDFTLIVGITPTGRATVQLFDMNRTRLVNLRRALIVSGKHPPTLNAN